ncbi:MAG TPA: LysE family transporter [Ilumatobacter sp.]|nr:LysE family transporter [Ilumatobacter sp.]
MQGIAVNVLNPKAALFFMAFLPQFMDPNANPSTQALVLGAVLFVIALTIDVLYALGAVAIGNRLANTRRATGQRRLLGATYLTLAAVAALTGHRPASA